MKKKISMLCAASVAFVALTGCANDRTFAAKEYAYDVGAVGRVAIDVIDREIEISLSHDDGIYISCYESSEEYYDVTVSDDGELFVKYASDKDRRDFIGSKPSAEYRKIAVKLPNAVLSDLRVRTTNENIVVNGLSVMGDISLSSNGGDVRIDRVSVGNSIELTAKNGDIAGTVVGSYDMFAIDCTIKKGDCNLPLDKPDGAKKLTADCNNGDISVNFVAD